jgi:hypothetical protein
MRRGLVLLSVGIGVAALGCSGSDASIDAGWGLTCQSSRVTSIDVDATSSTGEETPEAAIAVFVTNPIGGRLPAGGWERADFVATEQGTVPLTVPVPQAAYVRREGGRIDQVLTLEETPSGWVITGAHRCSD